MNFNVLKAMKTHDHNMMLKQSIQLSSTTDEDIDQYGEQRELYGEPNLEQLPWLAKQKITSKFKKHQTPKQINSKSNTEFCK